MTGEKPTREIEQILRDDTRNSMCWWWPRVVDCGVPMPETRIIEPGEGVLWRFFCAVADGEPPPDDSAWFPLLEAAAEELGYPCFLRTDLRSGKHGFDRTCFVPTAAELRRHIFPLLEETEDFMGSDCKALVVRKYIEPAAAFTAFRGNLPIGRERRYFVRDGQVECHHPYWPLEAIEDTPFINGKFVRLAEAEGAEFDWRPLLADLSAEPPEEIELLTGYAETIGQAVGVGYWSVDFMQGADGRWWFIDMAEGEASWHPECEYKQ